MFAIGYIITGFKKNSLVINHLVSPEGKYDLTTRTYLLHIDKENMEISLSKTKRNTTQILCHKSPNSESCDKN
jgi:hypothetical protein